jgi:putative phosphoribosyl transferase
MAAEIAANLAWPMYVLAVKKLPHPDNPEFAIGAVGLNDYVVRAQHADVPKPYIAREVKRIQQLLRRREETYHQAPLDVRGKTVIIVDDGIATGLTVRFAVDQIRSQNPRSIIIAVPVAASEAVHELHPLVDEFIVLHVPACFGGVGEWYENFTKVTDDEVQRCLDRRISVGSR